MFGLAMLCSPCCTMLPVSLRAKHWAYISHLHPGNDCRCKLGPAWLPSCESAKQFTSEGQLQCWPGPVVTAPSLTLPHSSPAVCKQLGHRPCPLQLPSACRHLNVPPMQSGSSRGIGLGRGEETQLRSLILSMIDEPLVLVVKLADRLHNMRTVFALRQDRQKSVAAETLQLWCGLAERLGMMALKVGLRQCASLWMRDTTCTGCASLLYVLPRGQTITVCQGVAFTPAWVAQPACTFLRCKWQMHDCSVQPETCPQPDCYAVACRLVCGLLTGTLLSS